MQSFTLENGLTILTHRDSKLVNAVVNLLYKVGSAQESSKETGLAHFLEHMMFEGSRSFPHFDESLQELLAENNAFTGQDYTCYYESFPTEHMSSVLDIELDRMCFLNLKSKNIELQKRVIEEEFKETSLNPPLSDAWHCLLKLCFPNSYQWPVIGKKIAHIQGYSKESIRKFYRQFYHPSNLVLSIVSPLKGEEVKEIIELKLTQLSLPKNTLENPKPKKFLTTKTGYKRLKRKNISSPHFFIAYHIEDYITPNYFLADMLSDWLTYGESSILYKLLITNMKLCVEVNSYTTDNIHSNLLIIEGKLNTGIRLEEVVSLIINTLDGLKSKSVTKIQFETLKNKALTYWAFQHYQPTSLAHNMGIFYAAQGVKNPIEYIQSSYDSIQKSQFMHFIRGFCFENYSLLEYEPYS